MNIPGVRAPVLPAAAPLDVSSLLGALKAQAAPTNFGGQAQKLAGADVAAAVAGIRAQQDAIRQAAAAQAGQVNDAAMAASKYLQSLGLGDAVAQDFANAAAAERAGAAGYAGGLRTTVDDAAAQVQHNLSALGSNQQAQNQGANAGNVLYGLGGNLPAATLDVVGPLAASSVRTLPAQTLGYGQAQAVGVMGAGAQRAAEFDANVAEEQAKRSQYAASYLKQLEDAARQAGQDRVANTLKVLGFQQDANAAAARAAYEQASLNLRADTANQSTAARLATANQTAQARADEAKALADYRAGRLTIDQFNAETSRIRARQAKAAAAAKPQIIGSDKAGRYRLNPDGTKTLLIPPVGTTSATRAKALTKTERDDITATVNVAFNGHPGGITKVIDPKDPSKLVYQQTPALPKRSYQETLNLLVNREQYPLAVVQKALNSLWRIGAPGARVVDGFILMPWEQPGEGRPLVPIQQRQARAKARSRGRRSTQSAGGQPVPGVPTITHPFYKR